MLSLVVVVWDSPVVVDEPVFTPVVVGGTFVIDGDGDTDVVENDENLVVVVEAPVTGEVEDIGNAEVDVAIGNGPVVVDCGSDVLVED